MAKKVEIYQGATPSTLVDIKNRRYGFNLGGGGGFEGAKLTK